MTDILERLRAFNPCSDADWFLTVKDAMTEIDRLRHREANAGISDGTRIDELLAANNHLLDEVRRERRTARIAAEWSKAAMEAAWFAALAEFEAQARGELTPLRSDAEGAGLQIVGHWHRQRLFSLATWGPGPRTAGVIDHIRKELVEIEADVADGQVKTDEWFDVVILACDGALRAGWTPEELAAGIVAKQMKNEARTWPDWQHADPDKAIEHDRSAE